MSVNGTLVEDKMRRFQGESAHFIFKKGPIYTRDSASAKFSINSQETDYSVEGGGITREDGVDRVKGGRHGERAPPPSASWAENAITTECTQASDCPSQSTLLASLGSLPSRIPSSPPPSSFYPLLNTQDHILISMDSFSDGLPFALHSSSSTLISDAMF
jgi:hypothetical protein